MYNADTTPKAPRQCKYIDALSTTSDKNRPKLMRVVYNTPHEAFFVALFLTCRWICEILIASKPKRTKTPSTIMYICSTSAHRDFRYGYRRYKGITFTLKTTFHGRQNAFLTGNLTLLNLATSKKWFYGQLITTLSPFWVGITSTSPSRVTSPLLPVTVGSPLCIDAGKAIRQVPPCSG